ncbi:MAG: hypothetical protein IPN29_13565 [Saprospiraceae bacterium]|nr:hypothetical protein [Saprospiraceae bacterium]
MKSRIISALFLGLILFMLDACNEESIPATLFPEDKAYYPLESGKFITYKYDSIVYDDQGFTKYNLSGYIREVTGELLKNTEDEQQYRLIKYWRKDTTDMWLLTDVETITATDGKLIRTEENLPFIRLVFPNDPNIRWNGNALFDENTTVKVYGEPIKMFQGWSYEVINKDVPLTLPAIALDSTLEVIEVDDDASIFSKRYVKQVYAKDIGPVKREMQIYDTQRPDAGKPWESYAEKGFSLVQVMIDHN